MVYWILGVLVGLVVVGLVWRLVSDRHSVPCPAWLRWMVELDNPFTRTNRAAVIIGHLDVQPGMTVLDAGCGPGRLALPLARAVGPGGRVVAMDLQRGMLDRVVERAGAEGIETIELLEAGLGRGELSEATFDRALLVTVLGEIPERAEAMAEVFRSLKPGGLLSVTEVIFDPHFQRQSTVRNLAEQAGFTITEVFGNRIAYTMHCTKPNAG